MLDAERGHPLLAEVRGGGRGRVAGQELQAIGDSMSAKMALAPGQCASSSAASWLVAATRISTRSSRVRTTVRSALVSPEYGAAGAQPVRAQPQVLGDDRGVAGVGLRAGEHLAVAPGLDRVRADRHDRVPGLEQRVDQPSVRALDRDRHIRRVAVAWPAGATAAANPSAVCAIVNSACDLARPRPARRPRASRRPSRPRRRTALQAAQATRSPHDGSDDPARRPTTGRSLTGALRRVPLSPVCSPARSRGRRCHAGPQRATAPGRHPGSRRVPTTSTLSVPMRKMVP